MLTYAPYLSSQNALVFTALYESIISNHSNVNMSIYIVNKSSDPWEKLHLELAAFATNETYRMVKENQQLIALN